MPGDATRVCRSTAEPASTGMPVFAGIDVRSATVVIALGETLPPRLFNAVTINLKYLPISASLIE